MVTLEITFNFWRTDVSRGTHYKWIRTTMFKATGWGINHTCKPFHLFIETPGQTWYLNSWIVWRVQCIIYLLMWNWSSGNYKAYFYDCSQSEVIPLFFFISSKIYVLERVKGTIRLNVNYESAAENLLVLLSVMFSRTFDLTFCFDKFIVKYTSKFTAWSEFPLENHAIQSTLN